MIRIAFLLLFCALLSLTGCIASGTVTDCKKFTTKIKNMKIANANALLVVSGSALMLVPLSKISSMKIVADETILYDRKEFCRTSIQLHDGTNIGEFDNPKRKNPTHAYVEANAILTGKTSAGSYEIMMNQLIKIEMFVNQ